MFYQKKKKKKRKKKKKERKRLSVTGKNTFLLVIYFDKTLFITQNVFYGQVQKKWPQSVKLGRPASFALTHLCPGKDYWADFYKSALFCRVQLEQACIRVKKIISPGLIYFYLTLSTNSVPFKILHIL